MQTLNRFFLSALLLISFGLASAQTDVQPDFEVSKEDLHGSWQMNLRAIMKAAMYQQMAAEMEDMSPEQQAFMEQMVAPIIAAMPEKMTMSFNADGTATATVPKEEAFEAGAPGAGAMTEEKTGSWEFVSTEGNRITIKFIDEDGEEDISTLVFLNKNEFIPEDMGELADMQGASFKREL